MAEPKKTGELLIESGIITKAELDDALDEQKRTGNKLGQILVERGFVSSAVLGKVLQDQLDVPYAHVDERDVDPACLTLYRRAAGSWNHGTAEDHLSPGLLRPGGRPHHEQRQTRIYFS
jgi:hypothetical protein